MLKLVFEELMRIVMLKIANFILFIGEIAVVGSCSVFFHEEEIPQELLEQHPFL